MKANELRIGNIVYVGGGKHPEVVKYIGERIYIDCSPVIHWDITSIEPIPLTEEWLVKFGFEHEGQAASRIIIQSDIGEISFYVKHNPVIKYVHQLQNLYFALTGEELTIK